MIKWNKFRVYSLPSCVIVYKHPRKHHIFNNEDLRIFNLYVRVISELIAWYWGRHVCYKSTVMTNVCMLLPKTRNKILFQNINDEQNGDQIQFRINSNFIKSLFRLLSASHSMYIWLKHFICTSLLANDCEAFTNKFENSFYFKNRNIIDFECLLADIFSRLESNLLCFIRCRLSF